MDLNWPDPGDVSIPVSFEAAIRSCVPTQFQKTPPVCSHSLDVNPDVPLRRDVMKSLVPEEKIEDSTEVKA